MTSEQEDKLKDPGRRAFSFGMVATAAGLLVPKSLDTLILTPEAPLIQPISPHPPVYWGPMFHTEGNVYRYIEAGEAIGRGDAVKIGSDGRAYRADSILESAGISTQDMPKGMKTEVCVQGKIGLPFTKEYSGI